MFDSKTLFVVGAGASKEAGLPTGNELKASIASKIDIQFESGYKLIHGEPEIVDALREHVKDANGGQGDINPYLHAGWHIRDAMPQANSIDNFIDAHQGNELIETCGKLAIVRSILEAEKRSKLSFDPHEANAKPNFQSFDGTWYNKFVQILVEGCRKDNINKIFDNVSFVIFNYDRCIEYFFYYALQNYYGITSEESSEVMKGLKIFHPYGTVGCFPWEENGVETDFGRSVRGNLLLSRAGQIKTFTEQVDDHESLNQIHKAVIEADKIVFLGFAYHQQNMELITPQKKGKPNLVLGTGKGVSNSECDVVRRSIANLTGLGNSSSKIVIGQNLSCNEFFDEYWRILTI